MAYMNKVMLIGNVGRDPETKDFWVVHQRGL
jgi:single-stranded DNA-binding protein